jgi:hypothetical protein
VPRANRKFQVSLVSQNGILNGPTLDLCRWRNSDVLIGDTSYGLYFIFDVNVAACALMGSQHFPNVVALG